MIQVACGGVDERYRLISTITQSPQIEPLQSGRISSHGAVFAGVGDGVVLPEGIGTHTMGEVSLTVLMNVLLHLDPRVGLSSDLLAVRSDRQTTTEHFDLIQGSAQLPLCLLHRPNCLTPLSFERCHQQ